MAKTNKEARAEADRQAIGGLRNPAASLEKVPGWWPLGAKVGNALRQVVRQHPEYISEVIGKIGSIDAQGPNAAIGWRSQARWAYRHPPFSPTIFGPRPLGP